MFVISAVEKATILSDDQELGCPDATCLFLFNTGARMGFQAAYNAIGYALLASNTLMTSRLTINAAMQSGVIGVGILAPIACCLQACCTSKEYKTSADNTLLCGACCEILNSVIVSLIGAQIQGLFASNITTPAYIAANAATGTATVAGGIAAVVLVFGGVVYFCAELENHEPILIPTKCFPNFKVKDLVRPCEIGLSVCNREQLLAFLNSCARCCPQSKSPAAPPSQTMHRQEYEREIPVAEVVDFSQAFPIAETINSASNPTAPSAPRLEVIEEQQEQQDESSKHKMAFI